MNYQLIKFFTLILLLFLNNCDVKKQTDKRNLLFLLGNLQTENNQVLSDCVYCTATKAFNGSCSCYTQIKFGTCSGFSSGEYKSNSYRVSCADLSSKGIWIQDNSGVYNCTFQTCPPEAYSSAFGKEENY